MTVTADDYTTNSDGEVTVLWYDWSKKAIDYAPVNAGAYYFKLKVAETSTADGNETEFQSKTTDYYKVVISSVEVNVATPHNFTYNGKTEYYVDYSTSAVNGERLIAYFIFYADNGEIWLDDWGFEVWSDTTEYTYNYVLVYEGDIWYSGSVCEDKAYTAELYDDKIVITFNYQNGTKTVTFAELEVSGILSELAENGEPKKALAFQQVLFCFSLNPQLRNPSNLLTASLFFCYNNCRMVK